MDVNQESFYCVITAASALLRTGSTLLPGHHLTCLATTSLQEEETLQDINLLWPAGNAGLQCQPQPQWLYIVTHLPSHLRENTGPPSWDRFYLCCLSQQTDSTSMYLPKLFFWKLSKWWICLTSYLLWGFGAGV